MNPSPQARDAGPLALGPLYEAQGRVKQDFIEFAGVWQTTKANWRDEPARQFEQESLASLGPTLRRVAAAIDAFAEAARQADEQLRDEG